MSEQLLIPPHYRSLLPLRETEQALIYIKEKFQEELIKVLNLERVTAPIIVSKSSGLNDHLSTPTSPIEFEIDSFDETGEIIGSLAKWKRQALADYHFEPGEGLYSDMNGIRPHEKIDNIHSLYVDQWDWERIIHKDERTIDFLHYYAQKIYTAIWETELRVCKNYQYLDPILPEKLFLIHSEELEQLWPDLCPKEREDKICQEKGAVFITGIGYNLKNGKPHDQRASDYDDWSTDTRDGRHGLNGDILVWYPVLNRAMPLSAMGIRVDKESLLRQLKLRGEEKKLAQHFHKKLVNDELPQTVGGGIGQSRLAMLYLKKAHIGEVQASIWPDDVRQKCEKNGINLL